MRGWSYPGWDERHSRYGSASLKTPAGPPSCALCARLHSLREPVPCLRGKAEHRPAAVLGVAHEHAAFPAGYFDAVAAVRGRVTRLPPSRGVYSVVHERSASFKSSRLAVRGSASTPSVAQRPSSFFTVSWSPAVCPWAALSR